MIDVRKLVLAGVLAAGFGVTPRTADASEVFIGILEKKWNISRVPAPSGAAPTGKGCLLCHDREKGGLDTATQPFGRTMIKAGVKQGSTSSLVSALDSVVRNHTNSDGDPVPDYEEIRRDFTSPNLASEFKVPPEPDAGTGEGGAAGTTGSGGEGASSDPGYYAPPPSDDLPPPFYHGCTLTPGAGDGSRASALFVIALAGLRAVRRPRARLTARRDSRRRTALRSSGPRGPSSRGGE